MDLRSYIVGSTFGFNIVWFCCDKFGWSSGSHTIVCGNAVSVFIFCYLSQKWIAKNLQYAINKEGVLIENAFLSRRS